MSVQTTPLSNKQRDDLASLLEYARHLDELCRIKGADGRSCGYEARRARTIRWLVEEALRARGETL